MLAKWRKRRAIKRYLLVLPSSLAQRYSSRDFYSSGQVRATIDASKLSRQYGEYALVLFVAAEEAKQELGSVIRYEQVRSELAESYFGGDMQFNLKPLKARPVGNLGHSSQGPTIEAFHD